MRDDSSLLALLRAIRDDGVGVVVGCEATEAATEAVVRRIAFVRETLYSEGMWKTEIKLGGNDTAYSSIPLPAHTDGTYLADSPGLQVWALE